MPDSPQPTEESKQPLTPSQSKAKKLIEELTEKSSTETETEEGLIAKQYLQGIWHGNAVPGIPRRRPRANDEDEESGEE